MTSDRDYKVTVDEFFANGGYSGKHFLEHFKYFLENRKKDDIEFQLFRRKLVLWRAKSPDMKLTMKPHYDGRSRKYATLLRRNTELFTVRCDAPPELLISAVAYYLRALA